MNKSNEHSNQQLSITSSWWSKTLQIKDKMRECRRRTVQELLQTLGHAQASDDRYYRTRLAEFRELIQRVQSIKKQVCDYRKAISNYRQVCSSLGDDMMGMVPTYNLGKNFDAEVFAKAMYNIRDQKDMKSGYRTCDDTLQAIIHSIDAKIEEMLSYKPLMEERERLKLDFDGYERKMASWEASKTLKDNQLKKKIEHVRSSQNKLDKATEELYRVFASYQAQRETLISTEMELFRATLNDFFSEGQQISGFKLTGLEKSKEEEYERADKLFRRMKARVSLTDSRFIKDGDVEEQVEQATSPVVVPASLHFGAPAPRQPVPRTLRKSLTISNEGRRYSDTSQMVRNLTYSVDGHRSSFSALEELISKSKLSEETNNSSYPKQVEANMNNAEEVPQEPVIQNELPPAPASQKQADTASPPQNNDNLLTTLSTLDDIPEGEEEEEE